MIKSSKSAIMSPRTLAKNQQNSDSHLGRSFLKGKTSNDTQKSSGHGNSSRSGGRKVSCRSALSFCEDMSIVLNGSELEQKATFSFLTFRENEQEAKEQCEKLVGQNEFLASELDIHKMEISRQEDLINRQQREIHDLKVKLGHALEQMEVCS